MIGNTGRPVARRQATSRPRLVSIATGIGVVRAVAGLGQQLQQRGEPGRVVADPALGQQRAVLVDQGDVVMVLGPVDPAEHRHRRFLSSSSTMTIRPVHSRGWGWSLLQGTRAP